MMTSIQDIQQALAEPLDPELELWLVDTPFGRMLKHPLVYGLLPINGYANKQLAHKKTALAKALLDTDWHSVVFLHERPYRMQALVDHVTGRDEDGYPRMVTPEHAELAADVWVDSENIGETMEDWRFLFLSGEVEWIGNPEERAAFDALPDPIPAWRGGAVGDWSWTTDIKTAEFFSRRSGLPVRHALIPKADVFGYLTRRGESELLATLTAERASLVYPVSGNHAADEERS